MQSLAESSLIEGLIVSPGLLDDVGREVRAGDFENAALGRVFDALQRLHDDGVTPDPLTLTEALNGDADPAFVSRLFDTSACADNVGHYARIVRKQSFSRRARALFAALAKQQDVDAADLLGAAEDQVSLLRDELRAGCEDKSLSVVTMPEVTEMDIPPRRAVLAPWLPEKGICLVHAFRGVGKTYFSLCTAYAIATGGEFLKFRAEQPRRVLYVDGEMPMRVLQDRLRELGPASENLSILAVDMQHGPAINIADDSSRAQLNRILDKGRFDVVILDNVQTLVRTGLTAASDEAWMPAQAWSLFQRASGRSVLWVDHDNRSGGLMGSGTKETVLDTAIHLRRPADWNPEDGASFDLHFTKNRGFYGDDAAPLNASLVAGPHGELAWSWQSLEASTHEKVVGLHHEGLKQSEIAEALGIRKQTVNAHIRRAKNAGEIAESAPRAGTRVSLSVS
jgi:hypothetical protein